MSYFSDHPDGNAARAYRIMRNPEPRPDGRPRRIEDYLSDGQIVVAADECARALKTRRYANDSELARFAFELAEAL